MSLPMPLLLPFASPRKQRIKHRTALLALLALLSFTCYLLFVAYPSLDLSRSLLTHVQDHDRVHVLQDNHIPDQSSARQRTEPHRKIPQQLQPVPAPRLPLSLSPSEELAALSAFIAALPHNVLPPTVDPNVPVDPQLVLDFDPRGETAREELDRVVEQVWTRFPVMLFTKLHSSDSREVRRILSGMHLNPAPLVVEVDQRQDAHVVLPLLTRLTHVPSLPILLIGGLPIGADAPDTMSLMADIRKLHEGGELARRILEAGATTKPEKRKGMRNKRH